MFHRRRYDEDDDYSKRSRLSRNGEYSRDSDRGRRFTSGDDRRDFGDKRGSWARARTPSPLAEKYTFKKNFLDEKSILSKKEVEAFRKENAMFVKGSDIPDPVLELTGLAVFKDVHQKLKNSYKVPTPIQAQGWPMALQGRDMVGIAQTGSGKTLSFVLPGLIHASDQNRKGPIVLVLAPTRELAVQINEVFLEYAPIYKLRSTVVYGGTSIVNQKKELRRGIDILVATPGRLIDLYNQGDVSLKHVTFLVLDEADRMLDMGFEPQLKQIIPLTNPERQTLMWSATWPKEVRNLAESYMSDYIQITIGEDELTVNKKIDQKVVVIENRAKRTRLITELENIKQKKTIVFCNTKRMCDDLEYYLIDKGFKASAIHGDKSQNARDTVIARFREGKRNILLATDVAARGLDVKDVKLVINFDFPKQTEDYVHRIGRTARGDVKEGLSISFFTQDDRNCAKELIKLLEDGNKEVPSELREIERRGPRRNNYNRRW